MPKQEVVTVDNRNADTFDTYSIFCDANHIKLKMGHAINAARIKNQVHDNTKPSAKMGRKAYRVSLRQPGCRNATLVLVPGFFCCRF